MEMRKQIVRTADTSDVKTIAALEKQLFSDAWTETMLADCLQQGHYVISVCEDELCSVNGYLITTHIAGEAELLRIGVDPAFRRQGIGRRLMEQLVKLCADRETPDVFLEVRQSNDSAISLYEQFGLTSVGRRKNYYHHPDEDAVLMAGVMKE